MHTIDDSAAAARTPQRRRGGRLALGTVAALGASAVLLGAHWIRRAELPRQDYTLETIELRAAGVGAAARKAGRCAVPVTVLDPPAGVTPVGTAVVLHGLAANRRVMLYLGQDFAGHGMRGFLPPSPRARGKPARDALSGAGFRGARHADLPARSAGAWRQPGGIFICASGAVRDGRGGDAREESRDRREDEHTDV